MADPNNNDAPEKYRLRPRKRCGTSEEEEEEVWTKRRRKGSSKSAPLSKYRRKTANARERSRMREINEAFDSLRRAVPAYGDGAERLTKISTLRLAMSYIAALSDALAQSDACPSPLGGEEAVDVQEDVDDFDPFVASATLDFDDFLAIDIT
ncbi:unnamed protein product [Nezara viridula]|uniref:BHLH domain-containing protein n=1 Tax=Nezara viridula TaxID=85310 RepID=A0A9P0HH40_NEZVI|nr:unnamed protein product [Nezara viridula]